MSVLRFRSPSGELQVPSVSGEASETVSLASAGGASLRRVVYVAGPYSAPTHTGIAANILAARECAMKVWQAGAAAICPHLNTHSHFEVDSGLTYQDYMDGDFEILKKCDAVFMMPTWEQSKGAKMEHEFARQHFIPILFSLDTLKSWLASKGREAATRQQLPAGDGVDVATLVEEDFRQHVGGCFGLKETYRDLRRMAFGLKCEMLDGNADALAVREEIIADIEARVEMGRKKYGTRLKTNNGRNVTLDLYQEILDACNYARQEIEQSK